MDNYDFPYKAKGEILTTLRGVMSKSAFAKKLKIPYRTYLRYETGEREVPDGLLELAKIFAGKKEIGAAWRESPKIGDALTTYEKADPERPPGLSDEEWQMVCNYRCASDEMREECFGMLERSAAKSREKRGGGSNSTDMKSA